LRIQQEILNHYTAKQHVTATPPVAISTPRNPIDHDTKKKVMLIREMEHEMDLEKVAPERELMAMRRAELDRFYDKVCSAHQQWWEAREYA
jgi:type IV pilus biogenesis protein CpaD/CtpE